MIGANQVNEDVLSLLISIDINNSAVADPQSAQPTLQSSYARTRLRFAEYCNTHVFETPTQGTVQPTTANREDQFERVTHVREDQGDKAHELVTMKMEHDMSTKFGYDILVAKYALTTVSYRSLEEAIEVILGQDEDGKLKHPFFGYIPEGFQPVDNESASDIQEVCFLCELPESRHQQDSDSLRQALDAMEAEFLEQFGVEDEGAFNDMPSQRLSRLSSHVRMQERMQSLGSQINLNQSQLIQQRSAHEPQTDYCEICYTTEIQTGNGPITDEYTVEFDCKHRFCVECCRESLSGHIKNNALEKITCFAHKCGRKITFEQVKRIFGEDNKEIIEKFEGFREKRVLEGNPLIRFCPVPDCDGHMEASDMNAKKLKCPKCSHAICFRCREDWHGYFTSCETAMERAFEGWADGEDRIIFCPMCRTKIQRSEGCNHMTCLFCSYEFCYFCGGHASSDAMHWAPGMGCGAGMMQDQGGPRGLFMRILLTVLAVIAGIIAFPIVMLLIGPLMFSVACIGASRQAAPVFGLCCLCMCPINFAIGVAIGLLLIPFVIIAIPSVFVVQLILKQVHKHRDKQKAMERIKQIIEANRRLVI